MTAPGPNSKGVIIPQNLKAAVVEALRSAKYGEITTIGEAFGLSRTRLYYYRKLAGVRFSPEDRAAYLRTRPTVATPAKRIPKTVGVPDSPRKHDFTEPEWNAFRLKVQREEIEELLRRVRLYRAAERGEVWALLTLYARYSKLRLPLIEGRLTAAQRSQLPWLHGNSNGAG